MRKNSYWWILLSPAFVAVAVLLHFWPSQFYIALIVLTGGAIVRLGIDSFVRRRRRNGPVGPGNASA